MERNEAIEYIAEKLSDELVICNLGFTCKELYHVKDSTKHFYMLGSIGLASSIGLGLACSTKRKVIVLDGDGSLLYNLGSMVTIAMQKPENLYWIVLDNQAHGSTGFQRTYDESITSVENLAIAAGFSNVKVASNKEELIDLMEMVKNKGPLFLRVGIERSNASVNPIPLTPSQIKTRFKEEVKRV